MRVEQEKVQRFHETYGFPHPDKPTMGHKHLGIQREALMAEELREYFEAFVRQDLEGVADAIADLAYTVLGTAVAHGIDLEPLFDEVHRSNMTKDVGKFKPHKGASFRPPRIAELLLKQTLNPEEAPL